MFFNIVGIRFLDDRTLVSASVDQRMILWVLEGDLPDLKVGQGHSSIYSPLHLDSESFASKGNLTPV